jgi:plastocyanin
MMTRRGAVIGGVALGMLAVAGSAWSQPAPQKFTVTMANMSFGQIPGNAKVGDTITWVNRDSVPHSVTARDRSFDVRLNPGKSATMTLQKAGSFALYCIYHPAMRGTLKVAAK